MSVPKPHLQVIRHGRLLDVKECAVREADVLIEGDTILAIEAPGSKMPEGALELDARGRLLMPGLVNAHTHGHGSLGKGLGDRWSLELFLNALPWAGGGFSLEDKHLAARLNAAEMVLKGCTAAYDMYFEFPRPSREGIEATARGYREVGVRVVLAPMMADSNLYHAVPGLLDALPQPHREQVERLRMTPYTESIEACREILDAWPFDRDWVQPALGPTIPLHCSDAFMQACVRLADEFDLRLQMHLAESKVQALAGIERYGATLTRHLRDLGVIGPRFTGAHCIWLDDDDIRILAGEGASVAHNPGSNLRLGSGIAPARALLDAGVTVGIGTDGSATSDNQNMFTALRLAAFVSRVTTPDYERWLGTPEVLRMATLEGAAALGWGRKIGVLEPGRQADIVFLDLSKVNYVPANDLPNQVVNCEDGTAVDSVMAGGRMVLDRGRFTTIDYDALCSEAQAAADRLRAANAPARERMQAMERFIGLHCVGMMREPYPVRRRLDWEG